MTLSQVFYAVEEFRYSVGRQRRAEFPGPALSAFNRRFKLWADIRRIPDGPDRAGDDLRRASDVAGVYGAAGAGLVISKSNA